MADKKLAPERIDLGDVWWIDEEHSCVPYSFAFGNFTLTCVEHNFSGMVGEHMCVRQWFKTTYSKEGVTFKKIDINEAKEIYKKLKGKTERIDFYYNVLQEFDGWSEDPTPYII